MGAGSRAEGRTGMGWMGGITVEVINIIARRPPVDRTPKAQDKL